MRNDLAEYLAKGFGPSEAAKLLGITPQTVQDYLKDESFKELLKEKAVEFIDARVEKKYSVLEEKVLDSLRDSLQYAEVNDMVRILESIAKIKKANTVPAGTFQNPTAGVTLVLPPNSVAKVVVNEQNQVVAIDNRSLAPMPSKAVQNLFKTFDGDGNVLTAAA